jgi:hypothetical protein
MTNINFLNDIFDFFTYCNQGKQDNLKQYFDGDWFIYQGSDIIELSKKPFVIKDIVKNKNEVELIIIPLKYGENISDNLIEQDEIILGFSIDTISNTVFDIPSKSSQYYGYTSLEISHFGFPKQIFIYEPAGE